MRKLINVIVAAFVAMFLITVPIPAFGSDTPSFDTCDNLSGWYANDDEQNDLPTPTVGGLLFEDKDLIHHAVKDPLALADVHGGTFEATGDPGKVVFKMETANPYSTIIQNADGKFWSSRLALDVPGGQNNPVSAVTDMIGSETKTGNPEYTNDTHVVTFGVGYWTEDGSTVVSSISFHGKTYSLTCKPKTSSPSPKPTTKKPTIKPSPSSSTPTAAGVARPPSNGPSLPVTGPSIGLVVGIGAGVLVAGAVLISLTRRRKNSFTA